MVSGANEYTAKPWASVSTVTPPIVAVFRLPAVAATGLLVLVLPLPLVEDVPDEPHAASTAAAAATAGSASSIRRRFGAFSRVSDLIIAFSFAPGPARALASGGTPTIPPRNRQCPASGPAASAPAPRPSPQPAPATSCLLPRSLAAGGLGCEEELRRN